MMSNTTDEFIQETPAFDIFNGFRLIDAHLQERGAVERYVQGKACDCAVRTEVCHQGCLFSQWFHGAEQKVADDLPLFNQLCKSCDEFYETATQAVLLKKAGNEASAQVILEEHSRYAESSNHFQESILTLHDKLHQKYRQLEG